MAEWQVDKMTSWKMWECQNDRLTKQQNDKTTEWLVEKMRAYKMTVRQSDRQNDRFIKWQVNKMASWQNVKLNV